MLFIRAKPLFHVLTSSECDKSFTRSDALAKHMRTVHETEALRPSDPVPRNHSQAQMKPQRLKLTFKGKAAEADEKEGLEVDDATVYADADADAASGFSYPSDVHFAEEELAMPPIQLYRLCRRQLHWSEQERDRLKKECEVLEAQLKEEWLAKELVLRNVMEAECATAHESDPRELPKILEILKELPATPLPMTGETVWFRVQGGDSEPQEQS